MSAQAKAAGDCGAACLIAEINGHAAYKRHEQGWLRKFIRRPSSSTDWLRLWDRKEGIDSICWKYRRCLESTGSTRISIDLGSDQTSLQSLVEVITLLDFLRRERKNAFRRA